MGVGAIASSYAPAGGGVFDPLSIGWSKAVWAEDPGASYTNGATAATVRNAGSISGDFTGSVGPTFRSSGASFNSQPILEFAAAANSVVSCATFTAITQPWSYVLVGRYRTTGAFAVMVDSQVAGHGAASMWRTNANALRWEAGTQRAGTNPGTTAHLFLMVANGASSICELDGTTNGTGTVGTNSSQSLRLGDTRNTGLPTAMDLAFFGLFNGNVTTDPDWATFETWVTSHYGITIA